MAETVAETRALSRTLPEHRPGRAPAVSAPDDDDDDDDLAPPKKAIDAPPVRLPRERDMRAQTQPRHVLLVFSFLVAVAIPLALIAWYLESRAADQYSSHAAFTIHSSEMQAPDDLFSQLLGMETEGATNADIVFDYISSQDMLQRVDAQLDLRRMWSREAAHDPVLSLAADAPVETLHGYWRAMVDVTYEARQGIIGIYARAFTPEDARRIAEAVVAESDLLVNRLSEAAKTDRVRYARQDLDDARARLEAKRAEFLAFRSVNRIIAPEAEADQRLAVVAMLQAQLAEEVVARTTLIDTTRSGDPRLEAADRRIAAVSRQIGIERARIGSTDPDADPLTRLLSQYEAMSIDLKFAGDAYVAASTALLVAGAEARRNSIYLEQHLAPSRPEAPQYPKRELLIGLAGVLLLMVWVGGVLIIYNIRDQS